MRGRLPSFGRALLAATLCLLAFSSAPAQAARVHQLLLAENLPEARTPVGVAVNQTTHHFYVATFGVTGVERQVLDYQESGQPNPLHPELTGAPPGFSPGNYVALHSSAGPTDGYIYVSDGDPQQGIQQYDPAGEATAVQITAGSIPADGTAQEDGLPPVINGGRFRPFALAIGPSGDIYTVATDLNEATNDGFTAIDVFDPSGSFLRQIAAEEISGTNGLALDASGDIYLANDSAPQGSPLRTEASPQGAGLFEIDPLGGCVQVGCAPIDPRPIRAVAIDQAGGAILTTKLPSSAEEDEERYEASFREYDLATHGLLGETRPSALHDPFGIAVQEDSGEVILTDLKPTGEGTFQIYGPVEIVPDVETLAPADLTSQGATLNGKIGAAGLSGATCLFQYVDQEEFEAHGFEGTPGHPAPTAPCEPAGPFSGEAMNSVHAEVEGLKGGTTYHQRLLGTNENGANPGEDLPFETTGPTIAASEVAEATETAITLKGTVNPNGAPTTYRFQYLTEADFEASGWSEATEVPAGGEAIGEGTEPVPVSERIEGLAPGTAYRFRILAESPGALSIGEEVPFATYAPPTTGLPDGRRYEQASPVAKNGSNVQGAISSVQAALSGGGITFFTNTGIPGGEGSQQFPTYLARRAADGSGWSTRGLLPPASYGPRASVLGWDEELQSTYDFATPAFAVGGLFRRASGNGALTRMGSIEAISNPFAFAGSSDDGAVALLESRAGGLTAGDLAAKQNLYAYDRAANQLVVAGVMNDGSVPPGGAMAGPYDWFEGGEEPLARYGGALGFYYTQAIHAISTDGSKVFFTAGGTGQIYVRVNPFGEAQELSSAACLAPANTKACTVRISAPEEGVTDPGTPAAFVGASADGNLAYFLDRGKLTADATGGAGYDLYRYDLASGELTDLTLDSADKKGARVEGLLGMGESGEDLYFVAAGALGPEASQAPGGETNLYELHGNTIGFVARLGTGEVGEEELNWVPVTKLSSGSAVTRSSRVSPDGQTLLFRSRGKLTAYANHGAAELYLHRASGGIVCPSCNPTGQAPAGQAGVQEIPPVGINLPRNYAFATRNLSADGRRVIFDSADRLVSADRNEVNDVYQWQEPGKGSCSEGSSSYVPSSAGCLQLISGGAEGADGSYFGDADEEGENVFFFTSQPLVAQDKDELVDLYDARVGGGIAAQEAEPFVPCEGEAGCRPPATPPAIAPSPLTPNVSGANVKPAKHCKRSSVRRHGKCVRKHRKRRAEHKRHRKHHRAKKRGDSGKGNRR